MYLAYVINFRYMIFSSGIFSRVSKAIPHESQVRISSSSWEIGKVSLFLAARKALLASEKEEMEPLRVLQFLFHPGCTLGLYLLAGFAAVRKLYTPIPQKRFQINLSFLLFRDPDQIRAV
jgi:hypothetical protein